MFLLRVLCLCCGLAGAGLAAAMPQHDHGAHAAYDGQPVAVPSPRWAVDPALHEGMARIHQALVELRHFEMGHMGETMARDRAGLIQVAVADVFAACKLQPQQDAVLHRVLVALLTATQRFKEQPASTDLSAMRLAVADYARYFDDPDWAEDVHTAHEDIR
jgi:hypothetical protein